MNYRRASTVGVEVSFLAVAEEDFQLLDDLKLTTRKPASGPIWFWMIDQLGRVNQVDGLISVAPEDRRLSVGQRVESLLVNILPDHKAVYKVPMRFMNKL